MCTAMVEAVQGLRHTSSTGGPAIERADVRDPAAVSAQGCDAGLRDRRRATRALSGDPAAASMEEVEERWRASLEELEDVKPRTMIT